MNEREEEILNGACAVFMKYGIKSVNMDDVAKNLRISKKTLYKYVSDKRDLINRCFDLVHSQEEKAITQICARGLNAIDEMFEISHFAVGMLQGLHPSIHFDMEKYYPEVWKDMVNKRDTQVYSCMHANMVKGMEEGLYRDNLKPEILAKIYITKLDAVFDGEIFPPDQVSFAEVYMELFRYHIRGIASEKGIAYLVEKMAKESKTNATKPNL